MSHLDEGTLHALLDGELGSTELMEIEAHLDGCAACSARLHDAREFLEEADRLVGSVQFGRFAAAASGAPGPAAKTQQAPPPPPPPPPPREHRPWQDESPVLLIPDNPESAPLIRRWPRIVGWAATIAVAVSGGYLASNMAKEKSAPDSTAPARGPTLASAPESNAVATAPAEPGRDSGNTSSADTQAAFAPGAAGRVNAKAEADKVAAAKPAPAKPASPKPAPPTTQARSRDLAAKNVKPPQDAAKTETPQSTASAGDTTDAAEEAATKAAEQEAIRIQAAQALDQLDRERRVSRAAAATASLDRQASVRRDSRPLAAAPPAPPTLEQRAQVYLRIGLDEANRQLGGPVHVIEGMSPVFMGLAPGRVAAGADTTRPVVRVVYQDAQGRMIILDQQRNRPGQTSAPAGGAWNLGDLTVGLRGDAPAEVLRTLRSRVR